MLKRIKEFFKSKRAKTVERPKFTPIPVRVRRNVPIHNSDMRSVHQWLDEVKDKQHGW